MKGNTMRKFIAGLVLASLAALGLVTAPPAAAAVSCNGQTVNQNNWQALPVPLVGPTDFVEVFWVGGTSSQKAFAPFDELMSSYPILIDLTGIGGGFTICGGAYDDSLVGGSGNDWIDGKGGDDAIEGKGGHDYIEGGTGDDFIRGNSGADTIKGQSGSDWIDGDTNSDTIYGHSGNDILFGGSGSGDKVYGGSGNDYLEDNSGLLDGDGGSDTCKGTAAMEVAGLMQSCETKRFF